MYIKEDFRNTTRVLQKFHTILTYILGAQGDSNIQSPAEIGPFRQQGRQGSFTRAFNQASHNKIVTKANDTNAPNQPPYMLINDDLMAKDRSSYDFNLDRSSSMAKKYEVSENDRLAYAMRILTDSDSLGRIYQEYERGDKDQYAKEMKAAEESNTFGFRDIYDLSDDERRVAISPNFIVFTQTEKKPQFFIHMCLEYTSFSSLWVIYIFE